MLTRKGKMEAIDEMKRLLQGLTEQMKTIATGQQEMKAGQEEMKSEIKAAQAAQEEMKTGLTEEMKKGQEEMRAGLAEEMKRGQEEIKTGLAEEMKRGQEEIKAGLAEEMKRGQEEMKKELSSVRDVLQEKLLVVENRTNAVESKVNEIEDGFFKVKERVDSMGETIKEKILEEFGKTIEEKIEKKLEESFDKKLEESLEINKDIKEERAVKASSNSPNIKLSTYDGKTPWKIFKTQFSIVAEANGWDSKTKASHLAASLRGDAADILGVLTAEESLDFDALSNALELRFGEKCLRDWSRLQLKTRQQKITESLQELGTDIERLAHQAYPDCSSEVRENLAMMHFIDAVKDSEIQKALRLADLKDLKSALIYAMKVESAHQASRKDRYQVKAARVENGEFDVAKLKELVHEIVREHSRKFSSNKFPKKPVKCWNCGAEGHLRKDCEESQKREKTSVKSNQGN